MTDDKDVEVLDVDDDSTSLKKQGKIRGKLVLAMCLLLCGIMALIGSSYAFLSVVLNGTKRISFSVGQFQVTFLEGQTFALRNISTMSKSEALEIAPYKFTIENTGDMGAYYRVALVDEGTVKPSAMISKEYLGYMLTGSDGTSLTGKVSELGSSYNLIREKYLEVGKKVEYTLRMWLTEDAPNSEMGKTYKSKVGVYSTQMTSTFADILIAKANKEGTVYNSGNQGEIFTYNQAATSYNSRLMEYRFIGSHPNNYVRFNNEIWRIVGVFETAAEGYHPKVKLVRESGMEGVYGVRNTSPNLLNAVRYFNQFEEASRKMVAEIPAYLGTVSKTKDASALYVDERKTNSITGEPPLSSVIHLLYLSDYAYTFGSGYQDSCFNNISSCTKTSWMNLGRQESLLAPVVGTTNKFYTIEANGSIGTKDVSDSVLTRPVVYLASGITISGGNGTKDNPYRLNG